MRPWELSMLALAFTYLVFVYWAVVGRAVTALVYPRFGVLRSWLVAPALGLAVVLLGLMAFNQAGIPIGRFALPFTLLLGLCAIAVLSWRRPPLPARQLTPFVAASVFALFWAGWPALESGFNWISYANDDMANYCLAAQRFLDHGFYDVPTMAELAGRDYSSYYYFMHVADMMRFGAEHVVAWCAAIAGIKPTHAFMPAILALSLVQISSVGALVLHTGRWRRQALVTVSLLAASPLFMLGTLYQVIAQVGGVALLLAITALLLRGWVTARRRVLAQYAVLPGILGAALCIFYPEVTPFAGLTFGAFAVIWTMRNRKLPAALVAIAAYTLLVVVLILRHNVISYVSILVVQFNGAMQASNLLLSLFPYFMLPTGFSNLYGWMPIAHDFREPVISVSIACGMALTVAILLRAVRDTWRLTPAALLLLIQFGFAVRLFTGANDFGLYKLAMWMQPVLIAGFAGWLVWWSRRSRWATLLSVLVYAVTAAPTALFYTNASRGMQSGGLTELRLASHLGLTANLPPDKNAQLTSTIENVVAAKFAASELRGRPLALVSRDFFTPTTRTDFKNPTWAVRLHPEYDSMALALPLIRERNKKLITTGSLWRTTFSQAIVDRPAEYYVSINRRLSLFNKFAENQPDDDARVMFESEQAWNVKNELLFVHSALGNHYYLGDRRRISFFQQEQDLFAPGHDFNGIGRFMLLRIEKPSPKVYLRISATRTLVTGRTAWKQMPVDQHGAPQPPVDSVGNPLCPIVRGSTDQAIGIVGNGAFNLFVGPIAPQEFEGAYYLGVDFAELPRQVLDYRTGLKRLYNRRVLLDYRQLLGWARDISAISETDYAQLSRPREIRNFPQDLALAHTLEYSGAYEDGWLSAHSKFVLAGTKAGNFVRLRGAIPASSDTKGTHGTVAIRLNEETVCELAASPGEFDWLLPVPRTSATTAIDLRFDTTLSLAGRDGRPVAAKLEYLGLANATSTLDIDYTRADGPRLAAAGVSNDGWAARETSIVLPPSDEPVELSLHVEYPDWSKEARGGSLVAQVAGSNLVSRVELVPGHRTTMRMVIPAAASLRTLRLSAPAEFSLPAPDTRKCSMRLLQIRLVPARTV